MRSRSSAEMGSAIHSARRRRSLADSFPQAGSGPPVWKRESWPRPAPVWEYARTQAVACAVLRSPPAGIGSAWRAMAAPPETSDARSWVGDDVLERIGSGPGAGRDRIFACQQF